MSLPLLLMRAHCDTVVQERAKLRAERVIEEAFD